MFDFSALWKSSVSLALFHIKHVREKCRFFEHLSFTEDSYFQSFYIFLLPAILRQAGFKNRQFISTYLSCILNLKEKLCLMQCFIFFTACKVIHHKYSKNCPNTVTNTIDCVCSKILNHRLNHGLFFSLFKLIPCQIH